jgi:ABC-type dipeptide/oligopeptide/nickel transport system ATPase component
MIVLNHGNVVETGDVEEMLQAPKTEYTRRLMEVSPTFSGYKCIMPSNSQARHDHAGLLAVGEPETFAPQKVM